MTCLHRASPVCVICIKESHRSCDDLDLLSLQEFYRFCEKQIEVDLSNNKYNRANMLNTKQSKNCKGNDATNMSEENQKWEKKNSIEDINTSTNNCKQRRDLNSILDSRIKMTLDLISSTFLKAQKQAVMQNEQLNTLRLEKIDDFKRDYKIKIDTTKKIIEIESSDTNKISRFLGMATFLKNNFDKNFQTQGPKLLQFTSDDLKINIAKIIQSSLIDLTTKPDINLIEAKAKANNPWRGVKGKLSQVIMFAEPLSKVLAEIQISNLHLKNSKNIEFLVMNKDGFDFWSKKLKNSKDFTFSAIPCIAKIDLDFSKGNIVSEYCNGLKQITSIEYSLAGSNKLIKKMNMFFRFSKKENKIGLYTYDNEEIVSDRLCKEQSAGNLVNNTLINKIRTKNIKQTNHSDQTIASEDFNDDWEDTISSCSDSNDESVSNNGNEGLEYSSQQKIKWERWDGQSELYLGIVFHHEFVKLISKFYEFVGDKAGQE